MLSIEIQPYHQGSISLGTMESRKTKKTGSQGEYSKSAVNPRALHSSSLSCRPQIVERIKSAPLVFRMTEEQPSGQHCRPSTQRESKGSEFGPDSSSLPSSPTNGKHAVSSKKHSDQIHVCCKTLSIGIPFLRLYIFTDDKRSPRKPARFAR